MAIYSPTLVLALVVLAFIVKINQVYSTFERIFFFNLLYCLDPTINELAAVSAAAAAPVVDPIPLATSASKKGGKKKTGQPRMTPRFTQTQR
jgi:hypothetical protein